MPTTLIKNGTLILEDKLCAAPLVLRDGVIHSVGRARAQRYDVMINAAGCFVSPGFIDTHIHGSPEDIFRNEIPFGTTSIVVALFCNSIKRLIKQCTALSAFSQKHPHGKSVLGVRIEGPYLNPVRAGAQDARFMRKPRVHECEELIRGCGKILKMVTLAPELKNSKALIRTLRKSGIIVSLGHTDATYDETMDALRFGASHVTHLLNAMRPIDRREPGVVGAVLSTRRVRAELIADGIHIHPALLALVIRHKGIEDTIVVTDSISAEAKAGSVYRAGAYRNRDGTLKGSGLTMIRALQNIMKFGTIALHDAVRLMTMNPARLFGYAKRKGSIAPGKDADLVIFDRRFNVKATIISGNVVFRKDRF